MCTSGHLKINLPHPAKLLLQEIFLKTKLRKFLQKCLTPEKIINSTRLSILQISKIVMYQFWYNHMKPKY